MASRQIRLVIAGLNRFVERIIKKLVLDIVANLQAAPSEGGTPRDTSWAAVNWVPKIGSAFEGTAGTRAEAKAGQLSQASETGVAQVLTEYKLPRGAVHITNNVHYILKLDGGSSKQAPAGFVRRGIIKAIRVDLAVGR